jgi:hypothetical protein
MLPHTGPQQRGLLLIRLCVARNLCKICPVQYGQSPSIELCTVDAGAYLHDSSSIKACRHKPDDVLSSMLLRARLRPRQGCKSTIATRRPHAMAVCCKGTGSIAPALGFKHSMRLMSGLDSGSRASREYDTQCRLVLLLLAWPHLHASSDPLFCEHLMLSASPVPATRLQLTQLRNNFQRYLSAHALLISSQ